MADHKKALHHHGKAGEAFRRGDVKAAAQQMGHALAALRSNAPAASGSDAPDDTASDAPAPAVTGLRGRLSGMKGSSGSTC